MQFNWLLLVRLQTWSTIICCLFGFYDISTVEGYLMPNCSFCNCKKIDCREHFWMSQSAFLFSQLNGFKYSNVILMILFDAYQLFVQSKLISSILIKHQQVFTTVLLLGGLWYYITYESWYAIKQWNQEQNIIKNTQRQIWHHHRTFSVSFVSTKFSVSLLSKKKKSNSYLTSLISTELVLRKRFKRKSSCIFFVWYYIWFLNIFSWIYSIRQ